MDLATYALEERAAILEYDAGLGLTREQAERKAREQIEAAERRGEQTEMFG